MIYYSPNTQHNEWKPSLQSTYRNVQQSEIANKRVSSSINRIWLLFQLLIANYLPIYW